MLYLTSFVRIERGMEKSHGGPGARHLFEFLDEFDASKE